jgi:hypothetical protein
MSLFRCAVTAASALVITMLTGCTIGAEPVVEESPPTAPAVVEAPGEQTSDADWSENTNPQRGPIGDHQSVVDRVCGDAPSGTDNGPRHGASGTAERSDADGLVTVYAVAPGDSYKAIVERFCLDSQSFATLNYIPNIGMIYEGDVYGFTPESVIEARRLAGWSFPACVRDERGYPDVASISWRTIEDDEQFATAEDIGAPIDTGAAGTAQGEARVDADGALVDYVVAAGDTWRGIKDRFCMDYYYVASLTGEFSEEPMIHPGDVIPLRPQHLKLSVGG